MKRGDGNAAARCDLTYGQFTMEASVIRGRFHFALDLKLTLGCTVILSDLQIERGTCSRQKKTKSFENKLGRNINDSGYGGDRDGGARSCSAAFGGRAKSKSINARPIEGQV